MKTNKINALEAVIAALEISESELAKWFNNRGKDKTGLIPTELPLVYCRGNELTVENGLNLSRKSELWGIQLLSGVMVALTCGSGNNVSDTTWGKVKKFAEKMTFNGKPGILPSKDVLKKHWGNKEEAKFAATVEVLEENEIEADGYRKFCFFLIAPMFFQNILERKNTRLAVESHLFGKFFDFIPCGL